jgi:hypothetical protein
MKEPIVKPLIAGEGIEDPTEMQEPEASTEQNF